MSATRFRYPKLAPRSQSTIRRLPVDSIFRMTFTMSSGAMNCPFFTLTTAPVSPAATTRSVWRARNAGIWRTSQTSATRAHCHGSWTSVSTGTSNFSRISARMSNPSSIPGPRNDATLVRFALSKLALKT